MRVVFSGGGTGGHLMPGIALAQALRRRNPAARILFLSTPRALDHQVLSRYGYETIPLPIYPGGRGAVGLPAATLLAISILKGVKPHCVIGLGGYGSLPGILAGRSLGIPAVLLEQNARPGRANRIAAWFSRRVYSSWGEARAWFRRSGQKFLLTGMPIREELSRRERAASCERLGLEVGRPTVAVLGGSQGARSLNALVPQAAIRGLQYLHLCGLGRSQETYRRYEENGIRARVIDFLHEMDLAYSVADLVISRAGGLAIAELAAFGCPSIFVPYPHAADHHQWSNALSLSSRGAGLLVSEGGDAVRRLSSLLERFARDPASFEKYGFRLGNLWNREAGDSILQDLESIAA